MICTVLSANTFQVLCLLCHSYFYFWIHSNLDSSINTFTLQKLSQAKLFSICSLQASYCQTQPSTSGNAFLVATSLYLSSFSCLSLSSEAAIKMKALTEFTLKAEIIKKTKAVREQIMKAWKVREQMKPLLWKNNEENVSRVLINIIT